MQKAVARDDLERRTRAHVLGEAHILRASRTRLAVRQQRIAALRFAQGLDRHRHALVQLLCQLVDAFDAAGFQFELGLAHRDAAALGLDLADVERKFDSASVQLQRHGRTLDLGDEDRRKTVPDVTIEDLADVAVVDIAQVRHVAVDFALPFTPRQDAVLGLRSKLERLDPSRTDLAYAQSSPLALQAKIVRVEIGRDVPACPARSLLEFAQQRVAQQPRHGVWRNAQRQLDFGGFIGVGHRSSLDASCKPAGEERRL